MSLIITWHPTYAMFRNPSEWGAFDVDIGRFARLVRGEIKRKPRKIVLNPTAKTFEEIAKDGLVFLDIETRSAEGDKNGFTGKDPTRCRIKTIGLSNRSHTLGASYVWVGDGRPTERALKRILANPALTVVLHNGPWFDLRVLERFGIIVAKWEDTRDARRAVSSTSPLKLSYVTSMYVDTDPWKEGEEDDDKGLVFTSDLKKLQVYNTKDCFNTGGSWDGITAEPDWNSPRVQRLYQLQKDLSVAFAELHTDGILFDRAEQTKLNKQLLDLYHGRAATLSRYVGIKGFKCSPPHMRALIFKRHETALVHRFSLPDPIDPLMWSDKEDWKTISVDQGALLLLLIDPDCPLELAKIIELYWHAEAAWKARATHVISHKVEQAIGLDGRLRASWNSCGTDVGRPSCGSPNLLNLSKVKDEEKGELAGDLPTPRSLYRASPGNVFVHADWSQLHPHLMHLMTGDKALGMALASKEGIYSALAKRIFNLPHDMDVKKVKPAARQNTKTGYLAFQYGIGTPKFYQTFLEQDRTLTYSAVSLIHSALKRELPGIVAYWAREQARVMATGYSESRILGRRKVYPRPPEITDTSNYPILGTESDIGNLAFLEIRRLYKKHLPSFRLRMHEYDAFTAEGPNRHANEAERIMVDVMTAPVTIEGKTISLPIEAKQGERLSEI